MSRLSAIMLVFCLVIFGFSTVHAAGMNFAIVDRQSVLDDYKETESVEQELAKAQTDRQEKIDARKKELDKELEALKELEKKKDPATESKRAEMRASLEKKFDELKTLHNKYMGELQTIEKKFVQTLKAKISTAIEEVAQKKGYSMVFEKEAVYFGGTDITEDVIKHLNKK